MTFNPVSPKLDTMATGISRMLIRPQVTDVDETTSIVGAPRARANPVLTIDHRAKIAHFQEQNKVVAPNDEFRSNDWILV